MIDGELILEEVRRTRSRIAPYIRHTPMAPPPRYSNSVSASLKIKLENLQVAGSFKSRGAFNNLLLLSDEEKRRGVMAASAGNHGYALAYAASKLGIDATIVLPKTATADRVQRIKSLGGIIIPHGRSTSESYAFAVKEAERLGKSFIHGFDGEKTWEGIGTLGLELLEDVPDMDCLLVAIGGGGLISGLATVIKQIRPEVKIIGVEPTGAASMCRSVQSGEVVTLSSVRTIADTLAVRAVTDSTFSTARKYVDSFALVTDEEIIAAMKYLWREYNQLVEPAGAAVIAAIQNGEVTLDGYRSPVALICGGNASARGCFAAYSRRVKKASKTA